MMNEARLLCSRVLSRVMIAVGMICEGTGEGGDPEYTYTKWQHTPMFVYYVSVT